MFYVCPLVFRTPALIVTLLLQFSALAADVWTPIGPNAATIFTLVRDPFNERELYAGTYFGGLYKSQDGGGTWRHLTSPFANGVVFSIGLDPAKPGKLFVGTLGLGTFQTSDGGTNWTAVDNGLPPVFVQSIALDPGQPGSVLAASFQGVFRSTNGGSIWQPSNGQLTNLPATALLFHPTTPQTVFVGTSGLGVFRSTDGGVNWNNFSSGIEGAIINTFSLRIGGAEVLASSTRGVYQLDPGATVWRDLSFNLRGTNVNQVHPRSDGSTLAATDKGIFILSSFQQTNWTLWGDVPARRILTGPIAGSYLVASLFGRLVVTYDQGKSFFPADYGLQNRFVGALATVNASGNTVLYAGTDLGLEFTSESFRVGSILPWTEGARFPGGVFAVVPAGPDSDTLFAAVERNGVLKGTRYGTVWSPSSSGMVPRGIYSLAESATIPPKIFVGTTDGLYVSTNQGATWFPDHSTRTPQVITSIVANQSRPKAIFYCTSDGMFYRSFDGGNVFQLSWRTPDGEGLSQIAVAPFFNIYAVGTTTLYVSTDDGATFLPTSSIKERVLSVAVDPIRPWNVYAGTALGIYRSTNNAIEWQKSNEGLSIPVIYSLAVDPIDAANIYAGSRSTIFKSTNGAVSWSESGTGLPTGEVLRLEVDPITTSRIFATISNVGIYSSTNAGDSWSPLLTDKEYQAAPPVLATRTTNQVILAGTLGSGVARSADNGLNWTKKNEGLTLFIRGLAIDPLSPTNLYAGSLVDGIFKSSDGGQTWQGKGLADRSIYGIAVDPVQSGNIYLATSSAVAVSRDYGETWFDQGQQIAFIFDLLHEPAHPQHFFIAGAQGDIFETVDGGKGWTPANHNLPRVNIVSIAADWPNEILYAAAERSGVFKSTNFGKAWVPVAPADSSALPVLRLAVVPETGGLLAGTDGNGVLLSTNQGASWDFKSLQDRDQVSDFAYDPVHQHVFAATSSGLARSIDFGKTWSAPGQRAAYVLKMVTDPRIPNRIYVGTIGGQIFRSDDGGLEWTWAGAGLPPFSIFALALDPRNGFLYASPERNGVYRSTDGGASWRLTSTNEISETKITNLAIAPATGDIWACTDGNGLFVSHDAGASWQKSALINYAQVFDVTFSSNLPNTLLASTSSGVVRSDDGGRSWVHQGQRTAEMLHVLLNPQVTNTVYAAGFDGSFYRSTDAGINWHRTGEGLPKLKISTLARDDETGLLYAALLGSGLYTSADEGDNWAPLDSIGLGRSTISNLIIARPPNGNPILIAATFGQGAMISRDLGNSWNPSPNDLGELNVSSLTIDPFRSGTFYAIGSSNHLTDQNFYLSSDFGATWSLITNGLPPGPILQIQPSPFSSNLLFALSDDAFYRSENSGQSWSRSTAGLPGNGLRIIGTDRVDPQLLYVGSTNGIYFSEDGGARWQITSNGLDHVVVAGFSAGSRRGEFYAATLNHGIIRSTEPGFSMGGVDPLLAAPVVFSALVDSLQTNILFAIASQGGFIKSIDGGATWFRTGNGLTSSQLHSLLQDPNDSRRIFIGTGDRGVFFSTDGGENWSQSTSEFPLLNAENLSMPPGGPLYIGSLGNGLLRSVDRGVTIEGGILPELLDPEIISLAIDPYYPNVILAPAQPTGLIISTNRGLTWRRLSGLSQQRIRQVEFDPARKGHVFASPYSGAIYRSSDGGMTWDKVFSTKKNLQIGALSLSQGRFFAGSLGEGLIHSTDAGLTWTGNAAPEAIKPIVLGIAVDPNAPNRILAATSGSGVLLSEDHGLNWTCSNTGLDDLILFAIAIDPMNSRIVYAASHGAGVYVSHDAGSTWSALNDGLFNRTVTSLALDVNDHRTVYAGTEGGGVFRLTRTSLPPQLFISLKPTTIRLHWAASASPFFLEETPYLAPPSWRKVESAPASINGGFEIVKPRSDGNFYFRLRSHDEQ